MIMSKVYLLELVGDTKPALQLHSSRILPILSTGGAPHMNVFRTGSSRRGKRLSSAGARIPLLFKNEKVEVVGDCCDMCGNDDWGLLPSTAKGDCPSELEEPAAWTPFTFSPSSILVTRDRANALASSSTSSKLSCLTALIEYAHTPTAKAAINAPVMAFRTRKGARARLSPGDISCLVTGKCK
jgi:hypothetical protein